MILPEVCVKSQDPYPYITIIPQDTADQTGHIDRCYGACDTLYLCLHFTREHPVGHVPRAPNESSRNYHNSACLQKLNTDW